jgi:RNA polymerase sigma-70 factor (ECF subfamily)
MAETPNTLKPTLMVPENVQMFSSTDISIAAETRSTPLDDIDGIVALYQPRIYRFLLGNLRDHDAAESLTQETFLRAWNARESFREDCSLVTWLMRIALNLARDHTRTGRFRFWKRASTSAVEASEVASFLPSRDSSAESHLIARQQVENIWDTVGKLSQRQRSVFLLRFMDEMEIHEIAAATGLPLGTVKSHLYRAIAAVRAQHADVLKERP